MNFAKGAQAARDRSLRQNYGKNLPICLDYTVTIFAIESLIGVSSTKLACARSGDISATTRVFENERIEREKNANFGVAFQTRTIVRWCN